MAHAASALAASYRGMPPDQVIFGATRRMKELRDKLEKLAHTNIPVLIRGESGTGKEIIAQVIHQMSPRRPASFAKVVCSAIRGTSLEEELFGVQPQVVKQATQGTLFFDEIGDLSKDLQAKLLQLLQDRQFSPIDARITDEVDVRMICATSRNLEQEIKSGDFRADLFYRINVASIDLPPLRERREDIPILVRYFLERFGAAGRSMSPELLRSFEEFSWPGNIRQLESVVQRYVVLGSEGELRSTLADPVVARTSRASEDGRMSLKRITREASRELEREIILRVLAENGGNRRKTAKALNISYRALLYKLREAAVAGIEIPKRRRKS